MRTKAIWTGLAFALGLSLGLSGNACAYSADFEAWLTANPAQRPRLERFEHFLKSQGVDGIFPVEQVLLSASQWQACKAQAYSIAPEADWPHIAPALIFIRDRVLPVTGPVEVVSGYRETQLNACAGGAKGSAHRGFWALDMVPRDKTLTREALIARVCEVHKRFGRDANIGLGFYSGLRFHIDSKSYRRWGADRQGASSPCG